VTTLFITSTGTDIGKTYVTAALLRHLRATGRTVQALKPVMSGFDPSQAAASDAGVLLDALGLPVSDKELDRLSPWRFAAPMSPDLAAARESKTIEFKRLIDFCRQAFDRKTEFAAIEGVGGIMVPLDQTHTVLDWMSALRLPVLLVAGSYLGAISHTLTALHVLAGRNLEIAAVAVSESPVGGATLEETVATIARFAQPIEVIGLPRLTLDASTHPAIARIAEIVLA
jgi:dethiobiotin synthetase